jgi:choline dehydrogenase
VIEADYVIVGGGTAGAVLANRLSADLKVSVILLEAGGDGNSFLVNLPVGYLRMLSRPKYDWAYEQEPDPTMDNRSWTWSAGKMLGGSSSLNGQVYIRGVRADFDDWVSMGAKGWSFNEVFPYFLRSEKWHGAPSQSHGANGPLSVRPMQDPHPLASIFVEACGQVGVPHVDDYNDGTGFGAFITQTNQDGGWRCRTERAYLRPIRTRPNLKILTGSVVELIRIVDRRAVGVTYNMGGERKDAKASCEVIVCAGALGSPALLMRSGIGPGEELRQHGIPIVHNLPGVGRNLQEHSACATARVLNVPTLNDEAGPFDIVRHFSRFLFKKSGPLVAPAVQAMALCKTRPELDRSNIQLHFLPVVFHSNDEIAVPSVLGFPRVSGVSVNVSLCKPQGRGRVTLNNALQPKVLHRALGNETDVKTLVEGLQFVDRLYQAPAFARVVEGYLSPTVALQTSEQWQEYLRANLTITWHAAGSCRMGSDPEAVVDPKLRVNGIQGLRVVDASVMPVTTSANTNATTIMIGERASDIILEARRT